MDKILKNYIIAEMRYLVYVNKDSISYDNLQNIKGVKCLLITGVKMANKFIFDNIADKEEFLPLEHKGDLIYIGTFDENTIICDPALPFDYKKIIIIRY